MVDGEAEKGSGEKAYILLDSRADFGREEEPALVVLLRRRGIAAFQNVLKLETGLLSHEWRVLRVLEHFAQRLRQQGL